MKRIISAFICVILAATFLTGCTKDRELYKVKLSKYVKVGDYVGIEVDTNSDEYKEYYQTCINNDVSSKDCYDVLKSGAVQKGDIANIDYVGKKDGKEFDGGKDEGYDLEIGSGTFIPGFEDKLIGVKIGDTVDLNLTFPEDYGNDELNGAAVVFTVTVNSLKRPQTPEKCFRSLGFKTVNSYKDDLKKRASISVITDILNESSEVIKYPERDVDIWYKAQYEAMEKYYKNYYGMDMETIIANYNYTPESFKKSILENTVYPEMKSQMIFYCILDSEKMKITDSEIENYISKMIEENDGMTRESIKENYEDYYIEFLYVREKVTDFLYEKAVIK